MILGALLTAPLAAAKEAQHEQKRAKTPQTTLRLPPGMARADHPGQVAALFNEQRKREVQERLESAPPAGHLTAAERYQLKLIAYRTQLVEQQRQRKIKELELQLEREARLRAEKAAALAERERRREAIYLQHHSVHTYQRRLNDEFWREQRLLRILAKRHHHRPCGSASAQSAPKLTPHLAPAFCGEAKSADQIP
jgi:hypothetical protein